MKNSKAKGLKQINNTSNKGLFRLGTDINTNDYHVLVQNKKEKKTYEMPFSLFNTGGGGGGSSYIPPYLKTGGASWSGTGFVYDVTALEYYFNGDKNTSATQVTLDASDPVNNRLDAIVVDEAGVVSVIKGDASASPISPSVDESHILVQYILVEAGSTQPTIAKEDIYLENAEWTTSTYTTGAATGSIDFDNAVSPKQGVKCISANSDALLGARFVRATSFDPYQYTMLSMWVRFTGSNVATNKSMNVRFENGAGALVANTINLFNFGLQRNLLNVWQLVVIPITSFGALPTSVKGLKIIMAGGTVGQARQWDIDYMILTNGSVPFANVPTIAFYKDDVGIASQSGINLIEGTGVTIDAVNNPLYNRVDYTINSSGGGGVITDGVTVFGDGVNTPLSSPPNQQGGKYRISGGAAWSGIGLIYDVSIINYYFNGNKYTVATQITLDASDPTNNRFDAVVVNEAGTVSIIKGTASASPVFPIIPDDKILIQYILVTANSVTPIIVQDQIHADYPTTNWTATNFTLSGTPVGSTNFSATTSPIPQKGSNYIKNNRDNQTGVQFIRTTAINLPDYTYMTVWVYLPIALNPSKKLNIRWQDASATPIGNILDLFSYGISRTNIGVWQMAYIPIYNFGSITNVQGIKFILDGEAIGSIREWDIDNILLSNGLVVGNSQVTPLSSLSPATSANVIDNGNKTQEWQWNSLTSGIGLNLSSNSTAATSNSQTLFSVNQSGANTISSQTTYGSIFSNTKTGTTSTNIGLMAIATGATNNIPIYAKTATSEVLRLQSTGSSGRWLSYWDNTVETGRIGFFSGNTDTYNVQLDIVNKTALGGIGMFVNSKTKPSLFVQNSGAVGINTSAPNYTLEIVPLTTNNYAIGVASGGIYRTYTASSNAGGFELINTTFSVSSGAHIQINSSGVFSIFHSASTTCISTGINLTSTNDVGIGASPSASAKLEVASTTQGFLPPRMTTTQKNAIPTPAEGLEVYDLTLHQKSYYNGTIWVNI